jgi:hypothetical protein
VPTLAQTDILKALIATARSALERGERETTDALIDEIVNLLGTMWEIPQPWADDRPWEVIPLELSPAASA